MGDFPLSIIPLAIFALYFVLRDWRKRSAQTKPPSAGGQFKRYGYRVTLPENFIPEKGSTVPADLRASLPESGYFFVVPLFLPDWPSSAEAISAGFLRCFDIALTDGNLRLEKTLRHASGFEGHEFSFLRTVDSVVYDFRLHVYHGKALAYLLAAISTKPETKARIHGVLDTVEFEDAGRPESFTESESHRHGEIYNNIGLYYFQNGDIHSSLNFFQSSTQYQPTEPAFLSNYTIALERLEKGEAALAFLRESLQASNMQILPPDEEKRNAQIGPLNLSEVIEKRRAQLVPLWLRLAILEARYGDRQKSLEMFTDAQERYPDLITDDAVVEHVRLLEVENQKETAVSVAMGCIERTGSIPVLIALSELFRRDGAFEKSLELLERRRNEFYFNGDLAFERIQALLDASRFRDEVDFCQELDSRMQFRSGLLYYKMATGQAALGLYREAQASLEKALKHSPGNHEIQSFLQQIAAMLGEGQNYELKNVIPQVELPAAPPPKETITPLPAGGSDIHYQLCGRILEMDPQGLRVSDHIQVQILTASGAQLFQSFQFAFNPLLETIFVNRARVTNPDGSVQNTDVSDMYTMDKKDPTMASDDRLLNFSLPGIAAGSKVEIIITRRKKDDTRELQFQEYYFSRGAPVHWTVFAVRGPDAEIQNLKAVHSPGVETKSEPGLRVWQAHELPAFIPEPGGLPVREIVPWVAVCGLAASWEAQAREYRAQLEAKLTPGDAEQKVLSELPDGSPAEKIKILYDYVQSRIQYNAIEFGVRGRDPAPASSTLIQRYGDCKDMTVLLCNLLNLAGVPAVPALMHSSTSVLLDLPSLDQFNHMVAVADESVILDPANKFHGCELQPPMNTGKRSLLLLDKNVGRFIQTPDYPADASRIQIVRRVHVPPDGPLQVEEDVLHQGYYAGFFREEMQNIPANYREKVLISRFERTGYHIESIQLPGDLSFSGDIHLSVRYQVTGALKNEAEIIVLSLPCLTELNFIRPGSFKLHSLPFQLEYGVTVQSRTVFKMDNLSFPNGVHYRSHREINFQTDFALQQEGEELIAEYLCTVNPGRYHPDQIPLLTRAATAAIDPFTREHRIAVLPGI